MSMPRKTKSKTRLPRLEVTRLGSLVLVGISFIPSDALPRLLQPWHQHLVDARQRVLPLARNVTHSAARKVTKLTDASSEAITVCSFSIQFLGNSTSRDDGALAADRAAVSRSRFRVQGARSEPAQAI